jgi:hypothetical protein
VIVWGEVMAFENRIYSVYAILGSVDALPWSTLAWARISKALTPLLARSRGRAAIRTTQSGGVAGSMKPISFGRLGFDEESAVKWTHAQRDELASGVRAVFVGAELWAPSWTSCERDGVPPDIFFSMRSEGAMGQRGEKRCFDSVLLLAIADGLSVDVTGAQVAREIGEAVGTVLTGHQIRPWGRSAVDWAFTNAIQDLIFAGLFAPGARHDKPVSLSLLKGEWTALPVIG